MTVQELRTHLEKSKTNLFVIGPYLDQYVSMTKEEVEMMCLKELVKAPECFYNIFNQKVALTETSRTIQVLEMLRPYIHKMYCQTTDSRFRSFNPVYLKGCDDSFRCLSCSTTYDHIEAPYLCDCGKKIRPNILLNHEKYNLNLIYDYEEDLKAANTIFLIGFDFNEEEFVKQLYFESNKKINQQGRVVTITVGECDAKTLFEEFHFDFIVDEKTDTAMERFVSFL